MVDRLLGRNNDDDAEKAGPLNIQTGPRGGRFYVSESGEHIYVDKNGNPVKGEAESVADHAAPKTDEPAKAPTELTDKQKKMQSAIDAAGIGKLKHEQGGGRGMGRNLPPKEPLDHPEEVTDADIRAAHGQPRNLPPKAPIDHPEPVTDAELKAAIKDGRIKVDAEGKLVDSQGARKVTGGSSASNRPAPVTDAEIRAAIKDGRLKVDAEGKLIERAKKALDIQDRGGRRVLSLVDVEAPQTSARRRLCLADFVDHAAKAEPAKKPEPDADTSTTPDVDAIMSVGKQLVDAFQSWDAQREGKEASGPAWATPASPDESPWQFVQRAAVEIGGTTEGQAVQAEFGSGREWLDFLALTLKSSGVKTSRGGESVSDAPDQAKKGDHNTKLTGPEALEVVLWGMQSSAKSWAAWKRGEDSPGNKCCGSAEENAAEETRRLKETPAEAAARYADSILGDVTWGADTNIIAMREAGGLQPFRASLMDTFMTGVAVEHAARPIPGMDATTPAALSPDVEKIPMDSQV